MRHPRDGHLSHGSAGSASYYQGVPEPHGAIGVFGSDLTGQAHRDGGDASLVGTVVRRQELLAKVVRSLMSQPITVPSMELVYREHCRRWTPHPWPVRCDRRADRAAVPCQGC